MLFVLLSGLAFLLVFALAEHGAQRARQQEVPTAAQVVPAAALSDRQDWLENGSLRFTDESREAPEGWRFFQVTDGDARVYRAVGESFLRLDCGGSTCIAGMWQRLPDTAAGDYLFEADVYLQPDAGGSVSARLGYDADGGVDPLGATVVWSTRAQDEGWQRLSLEVTETGGPGTVFVILDALSPEADCRVAGVRLLGPPGVLRAEPTPDPTPTTAAPSEADVEVRAAYLRLSELDLTDESRLTSLMDALAATRFNLVYVQARSDGLAYYASPLEPAAPALADGDAGVRWDPLAKVVELGHERGLQVHAWVELLPVWPADEAAPEAPAGHIYHTMSELLGADWLQPDAIEGRMAASPAVPEVRAYLASLCADLVKRYAVDGLHLGGLAVTGADEATAESSLSSLITEVADQARAGRPGLVVSVATEAVPPAGEEAPVVYGPRPSDAWWGSGTVNAVAISAVEGASATDLWSGGTTLVVLPVSGGSYEGLTPAIYEARKAGAAGIVLADATLLDRTGYREALARGPFARSAELPPSFTRDASP